MEELHNLVSVIAKALVDKPDQVKITPTEGEQVMVFELQVDRTDLGKIIGKQGNNIRAIRTILGAVSTKLRRRTVLELIED